MLYDRLEISFLSNDITTARDYRVNLTAHVVARDRMSGKVVLDRVVAGHSLMRVGSDLPSAERQTIPLVATDLARQITSLLVDGLVMAGQIWARAGSNVPWMLIC
jgi:hypothetical protein